MERSICPIIGEKRSTILFKKRMHRLFLGLIMSSIVLLPSTSISVPGGKPPIVYTLAGSDSGGGAGIQADLHAIHSFGCHPCTAITCLTAQNSVGVSAVHTPPAEFFQAQLNALTQDLPPVAIKIGMLGTKKLATQVGHFLKNTIHEQDQRIWVVLDPVMISTSGHRLIENETQEAMIEQVFPYADLLTPNKFEAEALLGRTIESKADVEQAAKDILDLGVPAVLIKGGHLEEEEGAQDYLLSRRKSEDESRLCDADRGVWLHSTRYETEDTHGTGCTLSSSIAAIMALGESERRLTHGTKRGAFSSIDIVDACCLAKAYIAAGIHAGVQLGQGPGPVAQTGFPKSSEYFPSIVGDNLLSFKPMKAMDTSQDAGADTLGRILPIVDDVAAVEELCRTPGVTDIQLRVKNISDRSDILDIVKKAQAHCAKSGVRLWVNDHWEAAIAAKCYGIHVGQEDLFKCHQVGGLHKIQAAGLAFGISTHSYSELAAAVGVKPSYISLGPIFATTSKQVNFDPQGTEIVRHWRQLIPSHVPLVVIGGIGDVATVEAVRAAGADCVAVIGAVTKASDKEQAVADLTNAMA